MSCSGARRITRRGVRSLFSLEIPLGVVVNTENAFAFAKTYIVVSSCSNPCFGIGLAYHRLDLSLCYIQISIEWIRQPRKVSDVVVLRSVVLQNQKLYVCHCKSKREV